MTVHVRDENGDWVSVVYDGAQGPQGEQGADGVGVPVGGTTGQVLGKTSDDDFDTEWVDQAGSILLAFQRYNPSTGVTVSLTSATYVDVDATNLSVEFTVPPSGAVLFMASVVVQSQNTATVGLNIREASSDLANTAQSVLRNTINSSIDTRILYRQRVTGLTPGNVLTWKLGAARDSGGGTAGIRVGNISTGTILAPATLEVWSS